MLRLVCLGALAARLEAAALECHQCTHTKDSLNNTYGLGNEACWGDSGEDNGVPAKCQDDEVCITRILSQWNGAGQQLHSVSRGCYGIPDYESCQYQSVGGIQTAECHTVCQEANCNDAASVSDVANLFNPKEVTKCEACKYYSNSDGWVEGNINCKDEVSNKNPVDCPAYARKACFQSKSIFYDNSGNQEVHVDRGCSAFDLQDVECTDKSTSGGQFHTCKETCISNDCNTEKPQFDLDDTPKDSCLVCSETVNEKNQTVGGGDVGCWQGKADYSQQCGEDQICRTSLETDWLAKGNMQFTVRRSCTAVTEEPPCLSGETSLIKYKDCTSLCDPRKDGPNCNSELDSVAEKFVAGRGVSQCYSCSWTQDYDGNSFGKKSCGEKIYEGNLNNIEITTCPKYAQNSCYFASSTHQDYTSNNDFEEDFRGCSPFEPNINKCSGMELTGLDHYNCKETCLNNNCNTDAHQVKTQCYSCTGTQDMSGAPAGATDARCWDPEQLDDSMLTNCGIGEDFCVTEITVDWFASGRQMAIIRRGCALNQPSETCDGSSQGHVYAFKDCYTSCKAEVDGGCNNDMAVGDKFKGDQNSCQQCYDIYHSDGEVEGNSKCQEEFSDADNQVECPNFASQACYSASAAHYIAGDQNTNRNDVYRGCSAFKVPTHDASTGWAEDGCYGGVYPDIDGVPQSYNMCKATCSGDNCNSLEAKNPDEDSVVPICNVCQVTVDQFNNTVGSGDPKCWEGTSSDLRQTCPSATDVCVTELEADWYPRGMIQYRLKRGCSPLNVPEDCISGSSSMLTYKDCATDCDPRGNSACNEGLEGVADKFQKDMSNVETCYACQYFQAQDGSVMGNPSCAREAEFAGSIKCPRYAQAACMEAASFHTSYTESETQEVEDDFRGCSPFILQGATDEEEQICNVAQLDGLSHRNCKHSCTDDNCNNNILTRGHSCYTCTGTRDAAGNPVGNSDDRCFFSLNESPEMMQDCGEGEDYCVDEMLVDWLPKGDQIATIRRGCSKYQPGDYCSAMEGDALIKYRDCYHYCLENGCNKDMQVAQGFAPGKSENVVQECYTCSYLEHDNGEVEGNELCPESFKDGEYDDLKSSCSPWQIKSCFTSATMHFGYEGSENAGQEINQIYKGCSSFKISGDIEFEDTMLEGENGDQTGYKISRSTCSYDDNCNEEHMSVNGDNTVGICQMCTVTKDMFNRTIGVGDNDCWTGNPSKFNQVCPIGQPYCRTEMLTDWMAKGEIQFMVSRGCSADPPNKITVCEEGGTNVISYKDCQVTCDPNLNGYGCNSGLQAVGQKFQQDIENPIDSCYSCYYKQEAKGEVAGNPNCWNDAVETNIRSNQCPMYANAACYTSSSTHLNYQSPTSSFEDDYRGCSPFNYPKYDDQWHCEEVKISGVFHEVCKGSCGESDCNSAPMQDPKPMCHTCSATMDSEGRFITGSGRCWNINENSTEFLAECSDDQPYCLDEMMIDWTGKGQQITYLRRSCAAEPANGACTGDNNTKFKYKDCMASCDAKVLDEETGRLSNGCNNNVTEIQLLFADTNIEPQARCYACSYIEADNGEQKGNLHCGQMEDADPEANINSLVQNCPIHASLGCYTGTSIHNFDGQDKEEVFKGCSSFWIDGDGYEYDEAELTEGVNYSMAKETCRGDSCNFPTRHPGTGPDTTPTDNPDSSTDSSTATTEGTTTTTTTTAGAERLSSFGALLFILVSVLLQ